MTRPALEVADIFRGRGATWRRPALDSYGRRPPHFPKHPKLDRLITTGFDAANGHFSLLLMRREARDLRKGLFGPVGSCETPIDKFGQRCAGVMMFDLPGGWILRLSYGAPPPEWVFTASKVLAEFLPRVPPRGQRHECASAGF